MENVVLVLESSSILNNFYVLYLILMMINMIKFWIDNKYSYIFYFDDDKYD